MTNTELKTFYNTPVANNYSFYLFEVGTPDQYQDWFQVIRNAGEHDLSKIHINSPGGRIDTTLQLVRALQDCKGTVMTSVEGECASAATIVFLCADMFEVSPHSMFMFHNYSGGTIGKGGEMLDKIIFESEWIPNPMRETYKDILTEQELEDMFKGKDIYKTSEEMLTLLKAKAEMEEDETPVEDVPEVDETPGLEPAEEEVIENYAPRYDKPSQTVVLQNLYDI